MPKLNSRVWSRECWSFQVIELVLDSVLKTNHTRLLESKLTSIHQIFQSHSNLDINFHQESQDFHAMMWWLLTQCNAKILLCIVPVLVKICKFKLLVQVKFSLSIESAQTFSNKILIGIQSKPSFNLILKDLLISSVKLMDHRNHLKSKRSNSLTLMEINFLQPLVSNLNTQSDGCFNQTIQNASKVPPSKFSNQNVSSSVDQNNAVYNH